MSLRLSAGGEELNLLSANEFIETMETSSEYGHLAPATRRSVSQWNEFTTAFAKKLPYDDEFLVTVIMRIERTLAPLGINVTKIEGSKVSGSLIIDTRKKTVEHLTQITVDIEDIIDWQYASLFELQGGFVYREIMERYESGVQFELCGKVPFVFEAHAQWADEVFGERFIRSEVVNKALKALWHEDFASLETLSEEIPDFWSKKFALPHRMSPFERVGSYAKYMPSTVTDFAVGFCNPQALMYSMGKSGIKLDAVDCDMIYRTVYLSNTKNFLFLWNRWRQQIPREQMSRILATAVRLNLDEVTRTILATEADWIRKDADTRWKITVDAASKTKRVITEFGVIDINYKPWVREKHDIEEKFPWVVDRLRMDAELEEFRQGKTSLKEFVSLWQYKMANSLLSDAAFVAFEVMPEIKDRQLTLAQIHCTRPLPINCFQMK
jgi:hypothetical protein